MPIGLTMSLRTPLRTEISRRLESKERSLKKSVIKLTELDRTSRSQAGDGEYCLLDSSFNFKAHAFDQ